MIMVYVQLQRDVYMPLSDGDKQIVYNLRHKPELMDGLKDYTDEQIIEAYNKFSVSTDYPDYTKLLLWIDIKED